MEVFLLLSNFKKELEVKDKLKLNKKIFFSLIKKNEKNEPPKEFLINISISFC